MPSKPVEGEKKLATNQQFPVCDLPLVLRQKGDGGKKSSIVQPTTPGTFNLSVIHRYRSSAANLRTQFNKIIKRAGHTPWPRLFQNLRASRETELMAKYPAKDVACWLGNSVAVAMKHYAMQTEEAFRKASAICEPLESELDATASADGGCISGVSGAIGQETQNDKTPVSHGKTGDFIAEDSNGNYYLVGDTGFEPVTSAV